MPKHENNHQVQGQLRRIEAKVRGLQKMIDDHRYCVDVLTQINAVKEDLETVALLLMADHTEHCVAEVISGGDAGVKVRELNVAVERLLRG
ncbi:MAG TPA: metal-sensitive transcriptional regulator [Candidatus Limnocylindria bacterium]|jgi:DNA-binding FrmR family transcriptional regulator